MNEIAQNLLSLFAQGQSFIQLPYQGKSHILPVTIDDTIQLQDLLEIDQQKLAATENLASFLQGKPYNHVLLWGSKGTGKSSLVRAMIHHFQPQGLKTLQLSNDTLEDLPFILWTLEQSKDYFLVYIDDLAFSANDGRYRALKAALDGALSKIASNILLCVTSNRRHLLHESHHDERALHPDEDDEEQISLAERFGLSLAFHSLNQKQYLKIVSYWYGQSLDENLTRQALQFALTRGSRSARVATQFVRSLGK